MEGVREEERWKDIRRGRKEGRQERIRQGGRKA